MHLPRRHYELRRRFVAALRKEHHGEAIVAAVSGGSDSMALLELLALAADELGTEVTIAHVDHRLRAETGAERELVAAGARRHGLAFDALAIEDPGAGDEAHLRSQRYAVLGALALRLGGATIATGHTSDDQTETVLLRLLRGAGRRGLAGMATPRPGVIRPLLGMRRAELKSFLEDRGVQWCHDSSNESARYARNRLRNQVIPAIEREFGRGALDHLPAMSRRWAAEERYLEQETRRYAGFVLSGSRRSTTMDLRALLDAPEALRTRLLRAWLRAVSGGAEPSMAHLASLERLLDARTRERRELRVLGTVVVAENGRLSALAPTGAHSDD